MRASHRERRDIVRRHLEDDGVRLREQHSRIARGKYRGGVAIDGGGEDVDAVVTDEGRRGRGQPRMRQDERDPAASD